ncbi:type II toxin-antitoxin system RelE/ParE family toxin [Microbacterium lushaniae]|uniref:Type II toxin-antitoxin system RelE/ParE family toxin n=1 Tax=Microbacterium lushaniae TaxID=2614639 RepID=A0A5J6L5N3_9MICO|nr:type II toxin-antitoxin system RelE/ParE family toxin [Microbacterium lushaniae]QEW03868.1 type II toxin-antitoxin system RelE/ParE family toxin [Microbacterium lushaniae]
MTYRWREHEAAHAELREAILFLEDQREGWGERFADAVEAAINSILESPDSWGLHRGRPRVPPVRSRSVAGFRYDIKYVVIEDEVIVLAYAHERRKPNYWSERL